MQYTIRGVSKEVDDLIRERAFKSGRSLNKTAVDVLSEGAGSNRPLQKNRQLNDIFTASSDQPNDDSAADVVNEFGPDLINFNVAWDVSACRCIEICMHRTIEILEYAASVTLPFSAVADIRVAFRHGAKPHEDERLLRRFLTKDGVKLAFPDDQTTHHYAALCRQLDQQGTPLQPNAIWTAALVLQHNLVLHSSDSFFSHLPQLWRI